jgi:hypothetical protein
MASETIPLKSASNAVDLDDDQQRSITAADVWLVDAMAELGAAYLQHEKAEAAYAAAKRTLQGCAAAAREAEVQRSMVLELVAKALGLPPGRWTYDAKQGTLVMEETPNAEPT